MYPGVCVISGAGPRAGTVANVVVIVVVEVLLSLKVTAFAEKSRQSSESTKVRQLCKFHSNSQLSQKENNIVDVTWWVTHICVVCHQGPMHGINRKQTPCHIQCQPAARLTVSMGDELLKTFNEEIEKLSRIFCFACCFQQCSHF